MASQALSTRTPLLRLVGAAPLLLSEGSGRSPGPTIVASGGPVARAIEAGRGEPDRYAPERSRLSDLRHAAIERIKAEVALIDRMDCAAAALLTVGGAG